MQKILFIVGVFVTTSCVHDVNISDADLKSLKVGQTSKTEIVSKFGEPWVEQQATSDGEHMPKACGKKGTQVDMMTYNAATMRTSRTVSLYVRGDNGKFCGSNVMKSTNF